MLDCKYTFSLNHVFDYLRICNLEKAACSGESPVKLISQTATLIHTISCLFCIHTYLICDGQSLSMCTCYWLVPFWKQISILQTMPWSLIFFALIFVRFCAVCSSWNYFVYIWWFQVFVALMALSPDGSMMSTVDIRLAEEGLGGLITLKFWTCGSRAGDYYLVTVIYEPHR